MTLPFKEGDAIFTVVPLNLNLIYILREILSFFRLESFLFCLFSQWFSCSRNAKVYFSSFMGSTVLYSVYICTYIYTAQYTVTRKYVPVHVLYSICTVCTYIYTVQKSVSLKYVPVHVYCIVYVLYVHIYTCTVQCYPQICTSTCILYSRCTVCTHIYTLYSTVFLQICTSTYIYTVQFSVFRKYVPVHILYNIHVNGVWCIFVHYEHIFYTICFF